MIGCHHGVQGGREGGARVGPGPPNIPGSSPEKNYRRRRSADIYKPGLVERVKLISFIGFKFPANCSPFVFVLIESDI